MIKEQATTQEKPVFGVGFKTKTPWHLYTNNHQWTRYYRFC